MTRGIVLGIMLMVLLVGCGGGGAASEASAPPASSPSPSVEKPLTAEAVVAALQAAGLPIGEVKVYTADSDPNALLGRPGQYAGKAAFHDSRIDDTAAPAFDVQRGGSVEFFGSAGDARQRADYIATVTQGIAPLLEYDYQHGKILLRLSHQLTPEQAAEYEAALKALPKS